MIKSTFASLLFICSFLIANTGFAQDQRATDDRILNEYFKKNNIKAIKTPSGLYYTVNKKGAGDNAKPGQAVTMLYYGYTLDGKRFDGNMEKDTYKPTGNPFTFNLG